MPGLVTRAAFPAMSIMVEITGVGVPEREAARAADLGRGLALQWESWFSRFRPDSQLCRLNAAGGAAVRFADEFLAMLETAKAAVQRTSGRFDPSILPALEAAGYDRSIEQVRAAPRCIAGEQHPAFGREGWDAVRIDRERGEARLPAGMRIDLGGIAKGAFVDRLASELSSWPGGCIDAGGDLRVWGVPPSGEGWRLGIEDPCHAGEDILIADLLTSDTFGVATSGVHRRRWSVGTTMAHHLIDPRSGTPLADGVRSVTAFAPDVTSAEIAAKAVIVAANEPTSSESFGATLAIVIRDDGSISSIQKESHHASSISFTWPFRRSA